ATFSVVSSYSVLQHFEKADATRALSEARRVLVEGGIAHVQMANRYGVRSLYHQAARGFRQPTDFEVRYWGPGALGAKDELLTELCEGLVRDHGCKVSVVAGVPLLSANGQATGPSSSRILTRERHHGIEILRARGTRFSKRRFAGRFSNYVTYFMSACYAGLRLDRPDVVVALTDPPIVGLAAYLTSRRFGVPFVMSYRDIFPEVARLLEDFQSETVNRVLNRVNRFLVQKANRTVA